MTKISPPFVEDFVWRILPFVPLPYGFKSLLFPPPIAEGVWVVGVIASN
ncbi:hypothetical protein [Helicobacter sp. T3_23-1056]